MNEKAQARIVAAKVYYERWPVLEPAGNGGEYMSQRSMGTKYPRLEIDLDTMRQNAGKMACLLGERGISVCGVVKFSNGSPEIARTYYEGGCIQIASSRVNHLEAIKAALPGVPTLLLRLPMLCEVAQAVRWCDISLNSSEETLVALNGEALRQNRNHGVILMLDVGDLREGVMDPAELCRLAVLVEEKFGNLRLLGVGSTFACYGSILPDGENLGALSSAAEMVESAIGRKLEIVSGGSSASLIPLLAGEMPSKINHLRIGGAIANPRNIRLNRGVTIPGMREDACLLRAQLIEVNRKPTRPFGRSSINWMGSKVEFEDTGVRLRGIAALGAADVGDPLKLTPEDSRMRVLGGSSDHTVLDIGDCGGDYRIGDEVSFRLAYGPLLYAFSTKQMHIDYRGR